MLYIVNVLSEVPVHFPMSLLVFFTVIWPLLLVIVVYTCVYYCFVDHFVYISWFHSYASTLSGIILQKLNLCRHSKCFCVSLLIDLPRLHLVLYLFIILFVFYFFVFKILAVFVF